MKFEANNIHLKMVYIAFPTTLEEPCVWDFSSKIMNSMKKLTVHLRLLSIIISQFVYHMIGFGICLNFKAVKEIWLSALNEKAAH